MSELKRVVRKNGKIVGVEPGDPHAPSAEDFAAAAKSLADAQRALEKTFAGAGIPLPQSDGLNAAVETIAQHWHTLPDDGRYALVQNFRDYTRGTARSAGDLAKALPKAHEADEELIKGEQSSE